MSRITTLLSVATHQIGIASVYPHTPAAPAISAAHTVGGPILVAVLLGIGCMVLLSRVKSVLVSLVSQLARVAAAVDRMIILIVILVVIGSIILLHS
jgi:uncharacterized membrane protein